MIKRTWTITCLLILVITGFAVSFFSSVSSLHLSGQQDAKREEWIASNSNMTKKYAYLTFDDGPSSNTDRILDILADKKVKATFFVVGKEGKLSRQRYRRILKEGHTLGMHSYTHDYESIYHSVEDFSKDIKKLESYLFEVTGTHPAVFRFPGGSSNSIVGDITPYVKWIHDQGYEYYDWNALSQDAVDLQASAATLNQNIFHDIHGQSPVIILMHDLAEANHTVEALPDLIAKLKERGYLLRPITEKTSVLHHVE